MEIVRTVLAEQKLALTDMDDGTIIIGTSQILPPEGWTVAEMTEDKVVFRAPRREAFLSVVKFAEDLTEDKFQETCEIGFRSARKLFAEVEVEKPFRDGDIRGVFFYGWDKSDGRIFCYSSLIEGEFRNLFVEGIGLAIEDLAQDFQKFVKALKRRWAEITAQEPRAASRRSHQRRAKFPPRSWPHRSPS